MNSSFSVGRTRTAAPAFDHLTRVAGVPWSGFLVAVSSHITDSAIVVDLCRELGFSSTTCAHHPPAYLPFRCRALRIARQRLGLRRQYNHVPNMHCIYCVDSAVHPLCPNSDPSWKMEHHKMEEQERGMVEGLGRPRGTKPENLELDLEEKRAGASEYWWGNWNWSRK